MTTSRAMTPGGPAVESLSAADFLALPGVYLDVRSPGEYSHAHIPGAINIPLFSDPERVVVGTAYKRQGPDVALSLGLEIVTPKLASFIAQAKGVLAGRHGKVYCWRGGMRSASMAALFSASGLPCNTLEGGYKRFRRWVLATLEQRRPLAVVGGYTGCGKTDALHALAECGEQVLDLEALACHRGSAFGGLGQGAQPSCEYFENEIALRWSAYDDGRVVWVEDESRLIGSCCIPKALFAQMRAAPLHVVSRPLEERTERLLLVYGGLPIDDLLGAVQRLAKRLGAERIRKIETLGRAGDLVGCIAEVLQYYDKAYGHTLRDLQGREHCHLDASGMDAATLAEHLTCAY